MKGRHTSDNDLGQVLGLEEAEKTCWRKCQDCQYMWRDTRAQRVRQKYDGQKVTNGYSKSKRIQDKRQSVKGQETWIVKGDDCEN